MQCLNFTNFFPPGQPDDNFGYHLECCVHMWYNIGKWNDAPCNFIGDPQTTMCEKLVPCN